MTIREELEARGFVAQVSDPEVWSALARESVTLYVGFDPTANSLHLGHLIPVIAMAHLQRAGHRVIALVGGATGMVGDPSGRSGERQLLTPEQVAQNVAGVKLQLERFLTFSGRNAAIMLDNNDWIAPMSFVDWLREVGKFFTVNYMVAKESVRNRMASESGISFTEFSYMTMQAYDFLHLLETQGCRLQCGGNDQWGNITAGIDLIRKAKGESAYGLTFPLVATSSGEKFGKSAGNAIWLDRARTSVYQFFQYWIQIDDADVEKFLKLFTFLPVDEIEVCCQSHKQAPHLRKAQATLAREVTLMVHGEEATERVIYASEKVFGGDLSGLSQQELLDIFAEVPPSPVDASRLDEGLALTDLLAEVGACKSKNEARRMVRQGAVYLNQKRVGDEERIVTADDIVGESLLVVRLGKKNHHLVVFQN
ncbi:MAG: tyrosine--tRNA ligase [Candidatus Brocadiia bacterium]